MSFCKERNFQLQCIFLHKKKIKPQNNSMYTSFVIALTLINKPASTVHPVGGRPPK